MSRIVPSQVVDIIDQIFPAAKYQKSFSVTSVHQHELAAIVSLIDQIPSELLMLDPNDYIAFQVAATTIKNTIPI